MLCAYGVLDGVIFARNLMNRKTDAKRTFIQRDSLVTSLVDLVVCLYFVCLFKWSVCIFVCVALA